MSTDPALALPKKPVFPPIRFAPREYGRALWRDARAAITHILRERAALAALILLLLPWFTLVFIRDNADWLKALAGGAAITLSFWFMSRSGALAAPSVAKPRLEFALALGLMILWAEYRVVMCGKYLPILPADFNCFNNWGLEVLPKLAVFVIIPMLVLRARRYDWRALGLRWDWRAWRIALLPLALFVAARLVDNPRDVAQFTGNNRDQFLFHFFGAGLPEEVLFRAILLTRLEAWWKNSAWALFGASLIFGLTHLPINFLVFTNRDPREAWITLLTFQTTYGAAFAFAYQRIRNVYPVAALHMLVNVV